MPPSPWSDTRETIYWNVVVLLRGNTVHILSLNSSFLIEPLIRHRCPWYSSFEVKLVQLIKWPFSCLRKTARCFTTIGLVAFLKPSTPWHPGLQRTQDSKLLRSKSPVQKHLWRLASSICLWQNSKTFIKAWYSSRGLSAMFFGKWLLER